MYKGLMKKIILTFLICISFIPLSIADNISDIRTRQIEDGLYNLIYIRQQMHAIDNDMIFYFGWTPEDKESMRIGAQQSIDKLTRLRTQLMTIGMPIELTSIKNELMDVLEKQKEIYRGVEAKKDEQIHESYVEFQKIFDEHIKNINRKLDQHLTFKPLSDDFSIIQEELKVFNDEKDKLAFEQANNYLSERKFKDSYDILLTLKDKYKNTPAEGSILMAISDCILSFDNDDLPEEVNTQENGLNLLSEIINKGVYYPILSDAFHRWRTTEQSYNHGMSNWSEIPNLEYNNKRMDIVRVIQQYLINHPDDNWAKIQIFSLLTLENIVRGEQFGNSNLRHTAGLYMDMDKIQSKADSEGE